MQKNSNYMAVHSLALPLLNILENSTLGRWILFLDSRDKTKKTGSGKLAYMLIRLIHFSLKYTSTDVQVSSLYASKHIL